jgi:6-phosphogluconate dehydrogenase
MTYKMDFVGSGVMSDTLALNIERNGFQIFGYDIDPVKIKTVLDSPASGKSIIGVEISSALITAQEKLHRILPIVKAIMAVSSLMIRFKSHLESGDSLVDGRNSRSPRYWMKFDDAWETYLRRLRCYLQVDYLFLKVMHTCASNSKSSIFPATKGDQYG